MFKGPHRIQCEWDWSALGSVSPLGRPDVGATRRVAPTARAGITASMALRLAAWLGTSPELWLGMQTQFDLWQAGQQPTPAIRPLECRAA
ncbi:HigA family addiction module antitoxin [Thauera aromatica]|uniref:HigA family addiction module antitoxin n=1 Tax=Thauera aromatica TaxID=59405 RepID=UPI0024950A53|nr:HigA family addiction module antitoxin [Thauera aromatica]